MAVSWTVAWPWPRVMIIGHYVLGFALDGATLKLYELYYEYLLWSAVEICSLGTASEIDQISVADFGKFYVVAVYGLDGDGEPVLTEIIRDTDEESGTDADISLPQAYAPQFMTCCNFNGQCVAGGIVGEAGSNWENLGLYHVAWSGIGDFEFRPQENMTAGFLALPWAKPWESISQGAVYKVAKLGGIVRVYADEGRANLKPYTLGEVSGFALGEVTGSGISSGNHMDGDENVHGFIDNNNDFWIATGKEETKLGYREYMNDLIDHDNRTIVTYVPSRRRFYISNGNEGYVLTENGLYSTHQLVTSIGDYRNAWLFGFWTSSGDTKARITTDTLDFGSRGFKTLGEVELGVTTREVDQDVEVSVYYRSNRKDAFTASDRVKVNPEGVAYINSTAHEFRISVEAESYNGLKLDYIKPHVQFGDRRFRRGIQG